MSPITPSISVNEPNSQAAIQTLSVVVPIYNEVDSIPHLVESIASILR
ncbi:MAG: glycosyltransferase, partial [Microcystis panniformis]